jgi:hypothetical protein
MITNDTQVNFFFSRHSRCHLTIFVKRHVDYDSVCHYPCMNTKLLVSCVYDQVKLHFWSLNPQLMPAIIKIQYSYFISTTISAIFMMRPKFIEIGQEKWKEYYFIKTLKVSLDDFCQKACWLWQRMSLSMYEYKTACKLCLWMLWILG